MTLSHFGLLGATYGHVSGLVCMAFFQATAYKGRFQKSATRKGEALVVTQGKGTGVKFAGIEEGEQRKKERKKRRRGQKKEIKGKKESK